MWLPWPLSSAELYVLYFSSQTAHHLFSSFFFSFTNYIIQFQEPVWQSWRTTSKTVFTSAFNHIYLFLFLTLHGATCRSSPLSAFFLSLSISAAAVKIYQISFGSDGVSMSTAAIESNQPAFSTPNKHRPSLPNVPPYVWLPKRCNVEPSLLFPISPGES